MSGAGVVLLAFSPMPLSAGLGPGGVKGAVVHIVAAVVLAGVGTFFIICQVKNRLVVVDDGLTYRYTLRTRHIAWPDVQSVGTMPVPGMGEWWWLQIQTPCGQTPIKSVKGRRKYVEGVAAEISALAADRRSNSPGA